MSSLMDWMKGSLICSAPQQDFSRLINICRTREIYFWNIWENEERIYFSIHLEDYYRLPSAAKKCHVIPHIEHRYGLPFVIARHKKHKSFFIGLALAAAIIYYLSGFIWNVEISGNVKNTDEVLMAFMREEGIHTGMRKSGADTDVLEEELRLNFGNISWVSAIIDGTVLKIELREGQNMTVSQENDDSVSGNIVAEHSGMITSMVTRTGRALVKEGDEVAAGDVLIEGIVPIYNDDETVRREYAVRADGDVRAQVTFHYRDYYPAFAVQKQYTGRDFMTLEGELLGKIISFVAHTPFEQECVEVISETVKFRLTPNFYLPVSVKKTVYRPYEPVIVPYSEEEIRSLGNAQIERYLKEFEKDGGAVLSHSLEISIYDDYYCIFGDICADIPIGSFEENER